MRMANVRIVSHDPTLRLWKPSDVLKQRVESVDVSTMGTARMNGRTTTREITRMWITSDQLARLTLEVWRASGPRTEARRQSILVSYAESYFGTSDRWSVDVKGIVDAAALRCRQNTRIDELQYV